MGAAGEGRGGRERGGRKGEGEGEGEREGEGEGGVLAGVCGEGSLWEGGVCDQRR